MPKALLEALVLNLYRNRYILKKRKCLIQEMTFL